jgi:hypothetical protein
MILSCSQPQPSHENSTSTKLDFEKHEGVTFKVDDVEMADSLLYVDSAKLVFENKIAKEIMFFPDEQAGLGLVNCLNNGLIETIQECYDNHRPLVLTPDVIWLTICQGVSIQINEKYDSLKNIIFIKNKPNEIEIRNDSLEYSAKHWKKLIESFSTETKKYTKDDYYSFFVSNFSTTSVIDKTAYQITLLESYKKAFEYIGDSGCGIPSIRIAGEKEDWQAILEKLDMLDKIGLANWAKNLKPIIIEFINVFDGKINTEFWQGIYKSASEYAAFYISGWIIKFFPYIKELEQKGVFDENSGQEKVGEIFLPNKFLEGDNYLLSTLSTDNFPSGLAKIPVIWNNQNKGITKKIEVYAGFFAIKQYPDKSLEPLISWAICEANAISPNHILSGKERLDLKHKPDYWSPNFADSICDSAVYDIKSFKSQYKSITFIKKVIKRSLQDQEVFKKADYEKDTILLQVLLNGRIGSVKMKNSKDKRLLNFITAQLKELPETWFPALAHPWNVFGFDITEEENRIKVRANSIVKIGL